jgi:MFS family permease
VAGFLIFAFGHHPAGFVVAGFLYGIYTGSCFIYMVYHAMLEQERAIQRVAINEICVGVSYAIGPLLGTGLLGRLHSFSRAYVIMAAIILLGVLLQTIIAFYRMRMYRQASTV